MKRQEKKKINVRHELPIQSNRNRTMIWAAGLTFGITAFLVKLIFYPAPMHNPLAVYGLMAGFVTGAAAWYLVIFRPGRSTLLRGALTGILVGLFTPAIMWILFGMFTSLIDTSARDAFGWSLTYALLTFTTLTAWLSALLGGALGVSLIRFQENLEDGNPAGLPRD